MDKQSSYIQPTKQGFPVMLVAQPIDDDEINLFDLFRTLAGHKWLIAACTAAATGIGLLYALLATPIYKVETSLIPPTLSDVAALQIAGDSATPETLFKRFSTALDSKSLRRDFFLHHGGQQKLAPEAKTDKELRTAFNSFDGSLTWKDGTLTMVGTDPKLITDVLNDFVQASEQKVRENVVADLQAENRTRTALINQTINARLAAASQALTNRMTQLQEAIAIAKRLGISEYKLPTVSTNPKGDSIGDAVATVEIPLYMRGTKALQAELDALHERKDNAAFVPGLNKLKQELLQLKSQSIQAKDFRLMRVDEAALTPDRPFEPRRKLIVLGSLLAGVLLGFIAVFLTESFVRNKEGNT